MVELNGAGISPNERVLDIGCGQSKASESIGLDCINFEGVDVVHTISKGRNLPFDESTFDRIYLIDIIEHVDDPLWLLSEVHRIGVGNAQVHMRYPHASSTNAYNDLTHVSHLGFRAFDHLDPNKTLGKEHQYYRSFGRNFPFDIQITDVTFYPNSVGKLLYSLLGARKYEAVVSQFIRVGNVSMDLTVLKDL